MSEAIEYPVVFNCNGDELLGICHKPKINRVKRGVVIVVGGPQYRVGSHRQFVIIARSLSDQGIPVFRFDTPGMGDSEGRATSFEDKASSIRCAIDTFYKEVPEINEVVLWGLCDGATSVALYAYQDNRVRGLVLVNPWVRTKDGEAKTYLRHYYVPYLFSGLFWKRVFTGKIKVFQSLRSVLSHLSRLSSFRVRGKHQDSQPLMTLPRKLHDSLSNFLGDVLIIVSGRDYTAAEFEELLKSDRNWEALLTSSHYQIVRFELADHTFSQRTLLDQLSVTTGKWVESV